MQLKASFTVVLATPREICIVDNDNGALTVTNDAEAVVEHCLKSYPGRRIFYKDTNGRWDELCHNGQKFTNFAPIKGSPNEPLALQLKHQQDSLLGVRCSMLHDSLLQTPEMWEQEAAKLEEQARLCKVIALIKRQILEENQ